MIALLIASLSCATWIYLLAARGGFWRAREHDADTLEAARHFEWPRIVAVVPARDEADVIGETLGSLLRQRYAGEFSAIVVDDHSCDGTATAATQAAARIDCANRLTVLAAPPLPAGWSGKLWAVEQGVKFSRALPDPPAYLLLTDADILFEPDALAQLVLRAARGDLVLASVMAELNCESLAERALIPAFVFFFQMLYPFAWVNCAHYPTAAAAGGCMLVRLRSLERAGGIAAIRSEIIDDCALARLLKPHGAIWLGLSHRVRSVRAYGSVEPIRRMVSRSAYAQLRYSPWMLACTLAGMALTYLAPPALALIGSGITQLLAAAAWAAMALAFAPTLRRYDASAWWGLALPLIAAAYVAFTLDSAWQHARGRGGLWKGRTHARIP